MSKQYSDSEIEEILDTQAQRMNRAFIKIIQSVRISQREILAAIAIVLIFVGIIVFMYALEREQ